MNNLHLCLNEFRYPSRVLKQVSSISSLDKIHKVYIASLHAPDLEKEEKISEKIFLKRFILKLRPLNKNLFIQFFKYIELIFRVLFFYKKKKIKIVNVHSIGILPLGFLFKLFYGSKIIYDTHELETEVNGLKGLRKKISKLIEYLLISKVDHTFVVSENIANWYKNNYNMPKPSVIFNSPKLQYPKKNDYFRKKFDLRNNQTIFLYQGGLQSGRGINLLLEVFKNRQNDKAIIIFLGYGDFQDEISSMSKKYKTIFFHKAVLPLRLLDYTVSADVGVHIINNSCLSHNYCMPNKLFEYAMAGLPVIVSDVKEMSDFVKLNKMGIIIKNNRVKELDNAINKMTSIDLKSFSINSKKAAIQNSWEHQENKMMNVYKNLI